MNFVQFLCPETLGGLGVEIIQSSGYLVPFIGGFGSSAFTFEDLPSDWAGSAFGADFSKGVSLSQQIAQEFKRLKACDPPKSEMDRLPQSEKQHESEWYNWWWSIVAGTLMTPAPGLFGRGCLGAPTSE